MINSLEPDSCAVCYHPVTQLCDQCKSIRYCSTTCQTTDWPTHKLLCASFTNFDLLSRPTQNHIRGVYFPVDKDKPEVVWLDTKWQERHDNPQNEPDGTGFELPLVEKSLGLVCQLRHSPINLNSAMRRELVDTIYVCHRDGFLFGVLADNQSVAAITATQPGEYYKWRGPIIIIYAKQGPFCKDLDMADFRHMTKYLLSDGNRLFTVPTQGLVHKIKGVKINCIGDEKTNNKPLFEAIEIPSTDPIFSGDHQDTSDIAHLIELPIFTRRCPKDPKWADEDENNNLVTSTNLNATYLHLCCDPEATPSLTTGIMGWGWAPRQWQSNVGSVIVVRQDKKPLLPLHLEVLCDFCRYEIGLLLGHACGEFGNRPMDPEAVLTMVCRTTFMLHWCKLLEARHNDGGDTVTPSPYEM